MPLQTALTAPTLSRRNLLKGLVGAGAVLVGATACSPYNASPVVGATKTASRSVAATPTVPSQALSVYRGHTGPVFSVSWSPDSTRLASGSFDNTVQVWDALNGSHPFVYRGHSDAVFSVAWSLDGKLLAS